MGRLRGWNRGPSIRPARARVAEDVEVEEHVVPCEDSVHIVLTRYRRGPPQGRAILLMHGASASSDMFTLPECRHFVETAHDAGWNDLWTLDWRTSCRLPHNTSDAEHSVDDVALQDLPAALRVLRAHTGEVRLAVVAHCVGSIALSLALASGTVDGLDAVVANSVYLTPSMPQRTQTKAAVAGPLVRWFLGGRKHVPTDFREVGFQSREALLFALASRGRPQCSNPACHMANFGWGAHAETLFEHLQLHPQTHDRIHEILGPIPLSYFSGLLKMAARGTTMRERGDGRSDALSLNALEDYAALDTPLLLTTGTQNHCWYDSNPRCYRELRRRLPQLDVELAEFPGYGHLDAFIGRSAAVDTFPVILDWLESKVPA